MTGQKTKVAPIVDPRNRSAHAQWAEKVDRNAWLDRLNPLRRTPQPVRPAAAYPVPPSRKSRKALTTWQDEAALKQLKHLAAELGVSQQALIAEGINHVLGNYGKLTVAT